MKAAAGRRVLVHYRCTLDDGSVFDSSEDREPLEFTLGDGSLIPGFEAAVRGMSPGDEKTVTLEPEQAYGRYDDGLVVEGPRGSFPPETIRVDQSYTVHLKGGGEAEARILRVTEDAVALDFNHPLAGKRLTFRLRLLDVR